MAPQRVTEWILSVNKVFITTNNKPMQDCRISFHNAQNKNKVVFSSSEE